MTVTPASRPDLDEPMIHLEIQPAAFVHPATVRWVVGAAVTAAVALSPARSAAVLATIAAFGAFAIAATALYGALRGQSWRSNLLVAGGFAAAGAALLAVNPSGQYTLARFVAFGLGLFALWGLAASLISRTDIRPRLPYVVLLLCAAILQLYPRQILGLILSALTVICSIFAVATVARLHHIGRENWDTSSASELIAGWFEQRPTVAEQVDELYDKVFYEGQHFERRVARFFSLMGFAAAIAALGVVTDSTAVVIGAMLIAPLMIPLMGIGLALSMGWPRRLGRAMALAATGAAWAILIGLIIGLLFGDFVDIVTNSQIQSRISPTPIDLVIAVAAGGAGAFGLSRPDISDSLPGVAIAIALVPPLTVVGICYSQGAVTEGNGALLLFLTNAVAIMLVGAITFVLTGVTPVDRLASGRQAVRVAALGIVALTTLVLGGLFLNGESVVSTAVIEGQVRGAVTEWVSMADGFEVMDLDISSEVVVVTIIGPFDSAVPATDQLATELAQQLQREITVEVRVIASERETVVATPTSEP